VEKNLEQKIETLPEVSGIYKFLNSENDILYIGKAINLKKRVQSYFNKDMYERPRIRQMMPYVSDVNIVETNNEVEALILESALIKKYQPPFNTELKDDKSYAWIYITTKDKFPTVKIVRSLKKGEYEKGKLFGPYPSGLVIKRVYSYLRKLYPFCTCKDKDCASSLYFHIGLCPGPYAGAISEEDYRENINNIIKFLSGKQRGHIKELERKMKGYSENQDFEKAVVLRDRINDLKYIGQEIKFTYYDDTGSYQSKRVKARKKSFESLEIDLGISPLHRIECYDISNIQGKYAYGSMVVAVDGVLDRSKYRIFKIKGKSTPDDFGMLKEVLQRRFKGDETLPELILIDGGKGQLSAIQDIVPDTVNILGISKGKHLKRKGLRKKDEFWIVREDGIYGIDIDEPAILVDLRDEAHRFAITHYRKRSIKESKKSALDSIDGVGEKRKKALFNRFKDINGIKKATVDEIYDVVKNRPLAERIKKSIS
jgi:excinuclease ABC subunit C